MRIKRSGLVNLFKIGANRAGPDLRSAVVDIVESSMGIVHGPDMNTLPPPLGILEDSDFWTHCYVAIQYLLVCTQNIGA